MLKFKYFHSGIHRLGFARQYKIKGEDRYLVILSTGHKLIIAQADANNKRNGTSWHQVLMDGEPAEPDDLIHALGIGLQKAEKI